jgi:hypothetical protein
MKKFSNNQVNNSAKAPIYSYRNIEALQNIDKSNTFSGNGSQYVQFNWGDGPTIDMTLKNPGIPYFFESGIIIGQPNKTLTIEKGTQIWLGAGTQIRVDEESVLIAIGTPTEPIVFRGLVDQAGYWNGINVATQFQGTRFAWCDISGGGHTGSWGANITLWQNSYLQLSNVNLRKSGKYGLLLDDTYNDYKIWSEQVTFGNSPGDWTHGPVWGYYTDVPMDMPKNTWTPTYPFPGFTFDDFLETLTSGNPSGSIVTDLELGSKTNAQWNTVAANATGYKGWKEYTDNYSTSSSVKYLYLFYSGYNETSFTELRGKIDTFMGDTLTYDNTLKVWGLAYGTGGASVCMTALAPSGGIKNDELGVTLPEGYVVLQFMRIVPRT